MVPYIQVEIEKTADTEDNTVAAVEVDVVAGEALVAEAAVVEEDVTAIVEERNNIKMMAAMNRTRNISYLKKYWKIY